MDVFTIIKVEVSWWVIVFYLGSVFEVCVDLLQGLEIETIQVDIIQIGDELFPSIVVIPLLADGVDIEGMHSNLPFLKDLHQFQLRVLLVPQTIIILLENIKDILDLPLHLIVKLNGLVGVYGIQCIPDQLIDVLRLVGVELLQDLLVVEDALDHIELLPFDQDFAVG